MRAYESMRAIVLVGAIAAGCTTPESPSTTADAGVDTTDAGDDCLALELGPQTFQNNQFGQLTGVRFPISPEIGEAQPEALLVEFYDSTTPDLPPLETGTFALGTAPNDNLATCQHCVWVPIDWDGFSPLRRVLLATEGSITLTEVEDPLGPVMTGSTTDLVLREASVSQSGTTSFVSGGRCARVSALTFSTAPTPGRACLSAEDCGNPLLEVCSPATGGCVPLECNEFTACPGLRPVCRVQYGTMDTGACYYTCNPTVLASCGQGRVCLQDGVDPTSGYCLLTGAGQLGDACTLEDTATHCGPGMTCSEVDQKCTRTCSYFADNPGCQNGYRCSVVGICEPESSGIAVAFGEACGETATLGQGCAADNGAFRGLCFSYEPRPLVCEKACFEDLGCEAGEFCALRFGGGLGVCRPIPVCGDGERGEINEVCDDGNRDSGDGCSADCQTVEYGEICPNAPLLTMGATSGDTTNAWDGFQATCQIGLARADVFRFDPPSRGRLHLTVESPTLHTVSVRTACADEETELACATSSEWGVREVIHQVTADTDVTVLVSAFSMIEHGPYTLNAEFTAENCGDGIVAGLEVCDDGNTNSNDGCKGDCSALEYDVLCAQAPELTTTITGNNAGGPRIYGSTCAESVLGKGPHRLYRYTAATSGKLKLALKPANPDADLVLAVFDSCGAPSTMEQLACSSVYDIERVEVPVTTGDTLTILVAGFHPHSVSPFTLTAELVP